MSFFDCFFFLLIDIIYHIQKYKFAKEKCTKLFVLFQKFLTHSRKKGDEAERKGQKLKRVVTSFTSGINFANLLNSVSPCQRQSLKILRSIRAHFHWNLYELRLTSVFPADCWQLGKQTQINRSQKHKILQFYPITESLFFKKPSKHRQI